MIEDEDEDCMASGADILHDLGPSGCRPGSRTDHQDRAVPINVPAISHDQRQLLEEK